MQVLVWCVYLLVIFGLRSSLPDRGIDLSSHHKDLLVNLYVEDWLAGTQPWIVSVGFLRIPPRYCRLAIIANTDRPPMVSAIFEDSRAENMIDQLTLRPEVPCSEPVLLIF